MKSIHADLETYSSVDLGDCGLYKYVESDDFEILLFAYAVDDETVKVIDLANGEEVPGWLIDALHDPAYLKFAHNAAFEFACLSKYYGKMDPAQWRCTMFHGLYCGYPGKLEAIGPALGFEEDKKKLATGKDLIRYFCKPVKPTKSNGGRTRNYARHDPPKWTLFKEYCGQDVVAEREIEERLANRPVPDWLQKQWETDLVINSRGVAVDLDLVKGAQAIDAKIRADLIEEATELSGLTNPNSVSKLVAWFNEDGRTEETVSDLKKETVSDMLADWKGDEVGKRMLEIRQELGKTSIKKYDAISGSVCKDGRVRGLLQFYGANRTGRWAGRLVQVQNLPRTYIHTLDLARGLVKEQNANGIQINYGSVPDTLSQLIRTAFIPSPGNVFIDVDFSAIEARVIAWLAGEEWRLNVFRTTGKIYESSAAMIYGVPVETIAKGQPNYHLRQRGKVAELALGYQGSVGAMRRMDVSHALDDMPDAEVQQIVNQWRDASKRIVGLWRRMEDAAINAVSNGRKVKVAIKEYDPERARYNEEITKAEAGAYSDYFNSGICIEVSCEYDHKHDNRWLAVKLPSGRKLYYNNPSLTRNKWDKPSLMFDGVDQTTKKWTHGETYGGKLVENLTQAIARDCLAEAVERLEAAGFPVVFHVHDEVIIDAAPFGDSETMLQRVVDIMKQQPSWAPGLPLNGDGWVGAYYKKD